MLKLSSMFPQNKDPFNKWYEIETQKQKNIYEEFFGSKTEFLQYYEDLLESDPTPHSYIMLGEAYMKVVEPEKALEQYEKALIEYPNHPAILSILGEALIRYHYFDRAISFYQQHNKGNSNFKFKLAELYLNLKHYQKAELLLLELQEDEDYLNDFKCKIKFLTLLAETQEATENIPHAIKNLENAAGICEKLNDGNESLIKITIKLGELANILNRKEHAINLYIKGLNYSPDNIGILLALAKAYLSTNNFIKCEETSLKVLQIDPYNELAKITLIDVSIRKLDFEKAISQCKELLSKQPSNFESLIRLINLLKRTGNLERSINYLQEAKKASRNRREIHFVEGLYNWYSGELNLAVKHFILAEQDPVIGNNALFNLLDIYLSTENFLNNIKLEKKVIEIFLSKLRIKLGPKYEKSYKYNILKNMLLIRTREKINIEQALDDLKSLDTPNDVGNILSISIGFLLLNQEKRALNQLKLISQTNWTPDNADYLENSWLLLADIYIKSNKFDNASKLLNKILYYDKSSRKTHEYLGLIFEKMQKINDAITHYTIAWKLGRKKNVPVGIRLASCFMKLKKYPTAIIIANEVLEINPDNNIVKEEILEKSITHLRC